MKLWIAVSTGLLATLVAGSSASAQRYEPYPSAPYRVERVRPAPPMSPWQRQAAAAAHDLADRSAHVAEMLVAVRGRSRLTRDAVALSNAASHFHHSVETIPSRRHAVEDFGLVEQRWQALQHTLRRSRDVHRAGHLREDWAELTHAFFRARDVLFGRPDGRVGHGYDVPYVHDDAPYYRSRPHVDERRRRPYRPRRAPRYELQLRIPG